MKATGWGCCAAALLAVALAGCEDSFFKGDSQNDHPPQPPQYHFVSGKLEQVAEKTKRTLHEMGIESFTLAEDEGVRFNCTTPAGKHLSLVLTRSPVNEAAFTNLRVEWKDVEETELTKQILTKLDVVLSNKG